MMSSDLEAQAAQHNMDDGYFHYTIAVKSQEDLANRGSVHENDSQTLRERVDDDDGVNSEKVTHGDDLETQLNRLKDSHTEPPIAVLTV